MYHVMTTMNDAYQIREHHTESLEEAKQKFHEFESMLEQDFNENDAAHIVVEMYSENYVDALMESSVNIIGSDAVFDYQDCTKKTMKVWEL